MKSATAYYLLLFYVIAVCKPALPLFLDAVAHEFFPTQHLAVLHHHPGASHVQTELKDVAGSESTDANSVASKSFNPVSVHLHDHDDCRVIFMSFSKPGYAVFAYPLLHTSSDLVTPPPEC